MTDLTTVTLTGTERRAVVEALLDDLRRDAAALIEQVDAYWSGGSDPFIAAADIGGSVELLTRKAQSLRRLVPEHTA